MLSNKKAGRIEFVPSENVNSPLSESCTHSRMGVSCSLVAKHSVRRVSDGRLDLPPLQTSKSCQRELCNSGTDCMPFWRTTQPVWKSVE